MGKTVRRTAPKRVVNGQGRQKTRSHVTKLLTPSDPAREERELALQLRSMGLYAANTVGDGNCLFRALSDQLYGNPKEHPSLRREICDYLSANAERYQYFVDDDRPFVDHVRVMRQNGTYGGHLELTAFAHLKKRWIKVVQPGLVYVVSCEDESPVASTSASGSAEPEAPAPVTRKGKGRASAASEAAEPEGDEGEGSTVYLAYHSWEHWSSVRSLDGPHQGPPRVVEKPREPDHLSSPSPTPPPPLPSADPHPTEDERLILTSLPPSSVSLEQVRLVRSELGGEDVAWERVVEVLLERGAERRFDFLKGEKDGGWRSDSPATSTSEDSLPRPTGSSTDLPTDLSPPSTASSSSEVSTPASNSRSASPAVAVAPSSTTTTSSPRRPLPAIEPMQTRSKSAHPLASSTTTSASASSSRPVKGKGKGAPAQTGKEKRMARKEAKLVKKSIRGMAQDDEGVQTRSRRGSGVAGEAVGKGFKELYI